MHTKCFSLWFHCLEGSRCAIVPLFPFALANEKPIESEHISPTKCAAFGEAINFTSCFATIISLADEIYNVEHMSRSCWHMLPNNDYFPKVNENFFCTE